MRGRQVAGRTGPARRPSSRRRQGRDEPSRRVDAEEAGDVAELVRLEVRVALAGDARACRSSSPSANLPGSPSACSRKPRSKPTLWPTRRRVAGERREAAAAASRGAGAPATSASVMPCIWCAEDRPARVHEGGEAIDDLAVADAHGADLDQVGHLGVAAGGLDVDDDELGRRAGDLLDEVEDGARCRARGSAIALGLADRGRASPPGCR